MATRRFTRMVLMAGLGVAGPATAEHLYCIDTLAGLDQAVRETEHDDVVIDLVQGTYNIAGTVLVSDEDFYAYNHSLTIRGGFVPGCAGRTSTPDFTMMKNPGGTIFFSAQGHLTLESFTLRDSTSVAVGNPFDHSSTVSLLNMRVDHVGSLHRSALDIVGNHVLVRQSLVVHSGSMFHCALNVDTLHLDTVTIENSVVADNAGDGVCISPYVDSNTGWRLDAYNNIFWNNAGTDVTTFESADLHLSNNIYDSSDFVPSPSIAPVATIDADPQFNDAANGNYFPGFASPALNSGSLFQPGGFPATDLLDDPRIIGSRIDRGPYESILDDGVIVTVTNTSDTPASPANGSLRKAIVDANAGGLYREIRFALPGGCAAHVIHLASPLPTITGGLFINGYSQAGSTPNAS